ARPSAPARTHLRPRALLDLPLRALVLRRATCGEPRRARPHRGRRRGDRPADPARLLWRAGRLFVPHARGSDLVSTRAGRVLEPSAVVGIGLEPAAASPDSSLLRELGLERPFLLY